MTPHPCLNLLEKYPQLKTAVEQGRFLTGYTNGSSLGASVSVFLFRSPWTQFCIEAIAGDTLPPGGVIIVSNESHWCPESNWKAYSLGIASASLEQIQQTTAIASEEPPSPLATLAAQIATSKVRSLSN